MEQFEMFPEDLTSTKVLVTIFSPELLESSIKACEILDGQNIAQELYVDETAKMEKQLKYADFKKIPYALIIGPKEAEENMATLKNLRTGEQKTITLDTLPDSIK
jgi:histidyl-tRNA synthetase